MARFRAFLDGGDPTEERLSEFLKVNPEWVRLEFKEARQVPVYGLRVGIAALASTAGGDLFVGGKDDGTFEGCSFNPAALSEALEQKGAPVFEEARTNLVEVVGDPVQILLGNGNRVFWFDVPEHGWVVAALKRDGRLGLYDRPGANSPEVTGLDAVTFYARPNRARILRRAYEEATVLDRDFNPVYQGEGKITDDTVAALRRIVNSDNWDRYLPRIERDMVRSDEYLALFLKLPARYSAWGRLPYQQRDSEMRMVKNAMGDALRRLRAYLERERILSLQPSA